MTFTEIVPMGKHKFEGYETCAHFEQGRQCCLDPGAEIHQVENFSVPNEDLNYWESYA